MEILVKIKIRLEFSPVGLKSTGLKFGVNLNDLDRVK